ncbi:hypothetical protein BLNAU_19617 [Blattamonas nauphoetae]|uniref:Uncharacterized protein n=1 Tax=Blattamonas nauphoetae TaxID=2049346 RepID=A0ABQ9X552_9EUKA|nr:hypothetical protein BLNAU_19617 [Blattamonas nauphoetae]
MSVKSKNEWDPHHQHIFKSAPRQLQNELHPTSPFSRYEQLLYVWTTKHHISYRALAPSELDKTFIEFYQETELSTQFYSSFAQECIHVCRNHGIRHFDFVADNADALQNETFRPCAGTFPFALSDVFVPIELEKEELLPRSPREDEATGFPPVPRHRQLIALGLRLIGNVPGFYVW